MKICLINSVPLDQVDRSHAFPFGFSSLNSWLEDKCGYNVELIFPELETLSDRMLFDRLRQTKPEVIGIGGFWDWLPRAIHLSKLVREALPESIIVMGGIMATPNSELVLRLSSANYVVRGEGEIAFEKLIKAVENKSQAYNIPGVSSVIDNKYVDNGYGEVVEKLEDIPDHNYNKFNMAFYHYNTFANATGPFNPYLSPIGEFLSGRGCPYNCNFCFSIQKFRTLPINISIERLSNYVKRYNLKYIMFCDDTFTFSKKWILEFCGKLKEANLGIKYLCTSRVNIFDDDIALALKESGCNAAHLAIEVADNDILKNMDKHITVEKAIASWDIAKKHGITPWISAMHGQPNESIQTFKKTSSVLLNAMDKNSLTRNIAFFPLIIYPGSPLYEEAKKRGLIKDDFDYYDIYHIKKEKISFLKYPYSLIYKLSVYISVNIHEKLFSNWIHNYRKILNQLQDIEKLEVDYDVKNILLIRSNRINEFREIKGIIKDCYPNSKINLIIQEDILNEISIEDYKEVITIPRGNFVLDENDEKWINKVKKLNIDYFIIPSNNKGFHGYSEILKLSCKISPKKTYMMYIDSAAFTIKEFNMLDSYFYIYKTIFINSFSLLKKAKTLREKIALLLVFFIHFLRPIIVIRLGSIYSTRIGHFAFDAEIYLCEKDSGFQPKKSIDFFYFNKQDCGKIFPVCNSFLCKLIKRSMNVYDFINDLYEANNKLSGNNIHKINIISRTNYHSRDVLCLLSKTKKHFNFSQKEDNEGKKQLANMGIKDNANYICIYGRDPAYLNELYPKINTSYHDFRDMEINNFLKGAEELTKKGYYFIRMGSKVCDGLNTNNKQIIDYSNSNFKSDFLDVYLSANCKFFIGIPGGIVSIPMVFRKPIAYINVIPLELILGWNSYDISIPKKIWSKAEQRILKFSEIISSGIGKFLKKEQYEKAGVEVIENSPDEIYDLMIEMEARLNGLWEDTSEDLELQKRFWSFFKPSEYNKQFNSRIGTLFLRKNRELL
ncbi:MAG: LA1599-like protein [uncultured bacterium]|nr:MAG: LA1599-like protein [uncultured bacterium]